jgi:hypothetical protein
MGSLLGKTAGVNNMTATAARTICSVRIFFIIYAFPERILLGGIVGFGPRHMSS